MSATFDLSAAIKEHRLSLGLSQGQYGARYKINSDTLALLEDNRHYADTISLPTLDRLLNALHMTREVYDPDFKRFAEARDELMWAKNAGALDRHIADYLGINSMGPIYRFFDCGGMKSNYHTARTAFALLEDDFRPFIEERLVNPQLKAETAQNGNLEVLRDKLEAKARQQGFVTWELADAELVGDKLVWHTSTGIYRMELSLKEFRGYYAKTNTLSIYRDFTKKPEPLIPLPKQKPEQKKIDPMAHYRQNEARNNASDLFRMIFGGG